MNPALKERMKKELLDVLASNHTHSELTDFYKCHSCAERVMAWKARKAKMGMGDPSKYLKWNKDDPRRTNPRIRKYGKM